MTSPAARDRWFLHSNRGGDEVMRLMCFPFAGGGASVFRGWADAFPANIEVRPVQLPGRETRIGEPCETDLTRLAVRTADALNPYFDLPVALFGYSFGGLLVFEVARELRRRSAPMPVALFIAATMAPQEPRLLPPMVDLPRDEFIAAVDRYLEPTDAAWKIPELMEMFLPIVRDDITAVERYCYRPEPPLSCPIHVYGGASDRVVSVAGAGAWQAQTTSTFDLRVFPGGHFFLHDTVAELQHDLVEKLAPHTAAWGRTEPRERGR